MHIAQYDVSQWRRAVVNILFFIIHYLRQGDYALPGVLSVWLLATLRKNYWRRRYDNFTEDVSLDKEDAVKLLRCTVNSLPLQTATHTLLPPWRLSIPQ